MVRWLDQPAMLKMANVRFRNWRTKFSAEGKVFPMGMIIDSARLDIYRWKDQLSM